MLKIYDNISEHIYKELYAEEQKSLKRNYKASRTFAATPSAINITNMLPALSG
jgi:hypothetical protein